MKNIGHFEGDRFTFNNNGSADFHLSTDTHEKDVKTIEKDVKTIIFKSDIGLSFPGRIHIIAWEMIEKININLDLT